MAAFNPVVQIERTGATAHIVFDRPDKRNAINDATMDALHGCFATPPDRGQGSDAKRCGRGIFPPGSTSGNRCSGPRRLSCVICATGTPS